MKSPLYCQNFVHMFFFFFFFLVTVDYFFLLLTISLPLVGRPMTVSTSMCLKVG